MLALITGRGALPAAVAGAQSSAPLICALDGHCPDGLEPDRSFRIEHLGTLLADMRTRGVTEVCFCGAITRPAIDPGQIDAATMPLVPVLAGAIAGGEDSALRAVLGVFETAGFTVRGAHELAPDLLPPQGAATDAKPSDDLAADRSAASAVLAEQGRDDQGQACVIRDGHVIAREGADGTDAMLAALGAAGQGAVLFKAPKPDQDRRVDLPTIGPATASHVVAARLDGIVIAHGGVMVLDLPQVVATLNAAGKFLWVR